MRYAITQDFDNFEEFDAFPNGWDTRFSLTRELMCEARLEHSRGHGVLINTASLSSASAQEGSTPRAMRTFALPQRLDGPMAWLGHEVGTQDLMQFGDSRELFAVAKGGCSICTLSLDATLIDGMLADRGVDAEVLFAQENVYELSGCERARLLRDMAYLSEFLVKYGQHDVMPALSMGLEADLLDSLVDNLAAGTMDRRSLKLETAARQVQAAMGFMRDHATDGLSVIELGQALGTSRRTLELSFQKYVGIPPKRYLNMLRLSRCREALLKAYPDETTVGEVAGKHGFWHMGQFGRDYRRMFAELPSETLRRV